MTLKIPARLKRSRGSQPRKNSRPKYRSLAGFDLGSSSLLPGSMSINQSGVVSQ